MSRRTWLVSVSIVGHLAIGVGLFASGIWKLERLDSDSRLAGIGVMTFTQAGGGSPADLPEPKFEKKKKTEVEKKIVKDVQWEKRVEKTDEKPKAAEVAETGGGGNGLGTGTGKEIGPGDDEIGGGTPCPPGATCTPEIPKLPDPPKPAPAVKLVAPTVLSALRVRGETQIHPSRETKSQIWADRKTEVVGTVKLCIQTTGAIGSAEMIKSTGYPAYDQQLIEAVRRWHYRPYMVDGVAHPACSPVRFVYSIK